MTAHSIFACVLHKEGAPDIWLMLSGMHLSVNVVEADGDSSASVLYHATMPSALRTMRMTIDGYADAGYETVLLEECAANRVPEPVCRDIEAAFETGTKVDLL